MKYDFFNCLSRDQARAFLDRFLMVESVNIDGIIRKYSSKGVNADFSIASVAPFMRLVAFELTTVPKAADMHLPQWILDTDSYAKNLFEFDDTSKSLTLRAAYYLGESFVRSHDTLSWSIGNQETAVANMPVVAGFQSGLEMAPILVGENLLRRVVADPTKIIQIDNAVSYWKVKV